MTVRVGEHFANEENDCDSNVCADPVQDFEVEDEICHDFDEQTFENDICLLRLKGSIKMNSKYKTWQFSYYCTYFKHTIHEHMKINKILPRISVKKD